MWDLFIRSLNNIKRIYENSNCKFSQFFAHSSAKRVHIHVHDQFTCYIILFMTRHIYLLTYSRCIQLNYIKKNFLFHNFHLSVWTQTKILFFYYVSLLWHFFFFYYFKLILYQLDKWIFSPTDLTSWKKTLKILIELKITFYDYIKNFNISKNKYYF